MIFLYTYNEVICIYTIDIKCKENSKAKLTLYKDKENVFSCDAVIGKNGYGKQKEGDLKTPLGTWKIGKAYGINDNPGTELEYTKITEDMYWCCNLESKNYNKLIYKKANDNIYDEHLIEFPIQYEYLLDIGFNKEVKKGAGSAIFLHCWKDDKTPTAGCIAISRENMIKILQEITQDTIVKIYK